MNRDFLRLVGQSSAVRLASAGVMLALSMILARSLGPEGFGNYSFAVMVIGLAVLIAQLGFPNLTVREVSTLLENKRYRLLRSYLQYATLTIAAMSLLLVAVVALAVPLLFGLSEPTNCKVIFAGLPLLLLFPVTAQTAAILQGMGRVVQSQVGQQLFRPALLFLLVGAFLLAEVPVTATTVMALHGLASLAVLIELRLRVAHTLQELGMSAKVSRARLMAWTGSAVAFSGAAIVQLINAKFDILAVGLLLTAVDVGLYAVGAQIAQAGAAMLMITAKIVQPAISRASTAGNDAEVERLCRQSAVLSTGVALLSLALVSIFGEWAIKLAFGFEYVEVLPALMILMSGQLLNAFFGPVGVLLNMRGKEQITLIVTFVASLVNIGLNFAMIPVLGLVGAASATLVAMTGWNLALWLYAWRLWGINASALPLRGYPRERDFQN